MSSASLAMSQPGPGWSCASLEMGVKECARAAGLQLQQADAHKAQTWDTGNCGSIYCSSLFLDSGVTTLSIQLKSIDHASFMHFPYRVISMPVNWLVKSWWLGKSSPHLTGEYNGHGSPCQAIRGLLTAKVLSFNCQWYVYILSWLQCQCYV